MRIFLSFVKIANYLAELDWQKYQGLDFFPLTMIEDLGNERTYNLLVYILCQKSQRLLNKHHQAIKVAIACRKGSISLQNLRIVFGKEYIRIEEKSVI